MIKSVFEKTCIFLITIVIVLTIKCYADEIILSNGLTIRGLVIEEYEDRIIVNTVDGEKEIFKSDIVDIRYDTEEQNLLKKGRFYQDKKDYEKALYYYKAALKINPDFQKAKDGFLLSQQMLWGAKDKETKKEIAAKNIILNRWDLRNNKHKDNLSRKKENVNKDKIEIKSLSIVIENSGEQRDIIVSEVKPDSYVKNEDIKHGDKIVAIWGRNVSYSKAKNVAVQLDGPAYSEVKLTIQREVKIDITNLTDSDKGKAIPFEITVEWDGFTIASIHDTKLSDILKTGDLIREINGKRTRYSTLDQVQKMITESNLLSLVIERQLRLLRR